MKKAAMQVAVLAMISCGAAARAQDAPGNLMVSVTVPGLNLQIGAQVKDDLLAGTEKFAQGASKVTEINLNPSTMGMVGRTYGPDGLLHVSQSAILNANYLRHKLEPDYEIAFPLMCQHEFVATAERQKEESGVTALDIAKRLLDFGMYAPTIYFPLIVHEAMMIEPTETETRETLDSFVSVMHQIAEEARTTPEVVKTAPHTTPVGRLDQALAARKPNLRWQPGQEETH